MISNFHVILIVKNKSSLTISMTVSKQSGIAASKGNKIIGFIMKTKTYVQKLIIHLYETTASQLVIIIKVASF